jgi:hypothetical protein
VQSLPPVGCAAACRAPSARSPATRCAPADPARAGWPRRHRRTGSGSPSRRPGQALGIGPGDDTAAGSLILARPCPVTRVDQSQQLLRGFFYPPARGGVEARAAAQGLQTLHQIHTIEAPVTFLQQRCDPGRLRTQTLALRRQQQVPATWRRRQARQLAPMRAQAAGVIQGIQRPQQLTRSRPGRRRRRIEPGQRGRVTHAPDRQFERQPRKVRRQDFRRVLGRQPILLLAAP